MTATQNATPVKHRSLPPGVDGSLWAARPLSGRVRFRNAMLRIDVDDPSAVLFPTDGGLSLLTALHEASEIEIAGCRALDIGSGSGLYTVALLAAGARHVTALDVNPAAEGVTRANVDANSLDAGRLCCVTTDLADFTPTKRFDLVISNPPHFPFSPAYAADSAIGSALVGGVTGRALFDLIVDRVDDLLTPNGTLLLAHSSLAGVAETVDRLAGKGYEARTLQIFELDIPMRSYAIHSAALLRELEQLRQDGVAVFDGTRFWQHSMAFRRTRRGPRYEHVADLDTAVNHTLAQA